MKAFARTTLLSTAVLATMLAVAAHNNNAVADVYKHVDENGNVTFSDKPREGSEKVKIRNASSRGNSSEDLTDEPIDDRPPEVAVKYGNLEILTPKEGKVVDPATDTVQIILLPTPALGENDELVINVDGRDINKGREVNLSVKNLPSGDHTVYGRIINSAGETVIESTKVKFSIGS